jgi:hypothetical protein
VEDLTFSRRYDLRYTAETTKCGRVKNAIAVSLAGAPLIAAAWSVSSVEALVSERRRADGKTGWRHPKSALRLV